MLCAQAGNENISYSTGNFFMKGNRPTTKEYIVDGLPYIDGDKFYKVEVKDYSKDVQTLRYNAFEDEMEFKNGDQLYYANKENNLSIHFTDLNKTYRCLQYRYNGNTKFGYLVILVENSKNSLYKKESIELLKGEKSPNAYSKDANDYYAKEKDLFLIGKDTQLLKFPKNAGDFAETFSLDKNIVADYIKKNKINFNKEKDLIKLVDFLNQR